MGKTFIFFALLIFVFEILAQDRSEPKQLTFDPAQNAFPNFSPDGKSIVYQYTDMRGDSLNKNGLWVTSLDRKEARQIFKGLAEHPKWSPDGRFIVFDSDTGNSIKMIDLKSEDVIDFLPDTIQIKHGGLPSWSPDASKTAFLERKDTSLCIYDMKTCGVKSIYSKEGMIPLPGCWSTDGKYILVAFSDRKTRKSTMWKISIDGKTHEQIHGHHENFWRHMAISPNGSLLVCAAMESRFMGLWIMPAEGGKSLPLTITPNSHNEGAAWSPNGKSIAFNSTRSGNFDIWIMDIDISQIKKELNELNK